jgi:2-keto-3-deoxy-L-fuconate dehydrogenase
MTACQKRAAPDAAGEEAMPRLAGKRIVITQASAFMGPDIATLFAAEGAMLRADDRDLTQPGAAEALIAEAGELDVLVANLATEAPRRPVLETDDATFRAMYEAMVFPLHRLVRAVLPQMLARRRGKIVVIGSASALRGQPNYTAYGSARAAQLGYVQDVGIEVAPHNVQVNAIAQTFVANPTYFPESYQRTAEFQERLRGAPVGRLAQGWESAALALFLAGDESDFFVGQVFPFAGGWVTR